MTRGSFLASFLAIVLALLGLRAPMDVSFPPRVRGNVTVHYEHGGSAQFDTISAAIETVTGRSKDVVYVYPAGPR